MAAKLEMKPGTLFSLYLLRAQMIANTVKMPAAIFNSITMFGVNISSSLLEVGRTRNVL